jgi:hypothetical protein
MRSLAPPVAYMTVKVLYIAYDRDMQQSRAKNVCFYSNRCQWSKAFLSELAKTPYKDEFRYICVDPSPNRPKLPSFLKKVPTLIIYGDDEPKTDGDVMNWLSQRMLTDGMHARRAQGQGQQDEGGSDVLDYYSCEMDNGGQDMYSFIDSDTLVTGNGGTRIQQTYSFVNEQQVQQPPQQRAAAQQQSQSRQSSQKSKKEELLDKQYEEYIKMRDVGMPKTIARQ